MLINPKKILQKGSVDKAIKLVKMGKIKEAEKAIKPAVNYLIKMRCKNKKDSFSEAFKIICLEADFFNS